jgi:N-acetylmuramoyl-L-alanine amidase
MPHTERDIDTLARTIWGEARNQGRTGMIAVAWVIRNRVGMDLHNDGKPDWWGEGYEGVCLRKWQFSCWNPGDPNEPYLRGRKAIPGRQYAEAREAALAAMHAYEPDPTGGATHYYAPKVVKAPAWVKGATKAATIGGHIFYKDVP